MVKLNIKFNPLKNDVEKYIIKFIKKQKYTTHFFKKIDDKLCNQIMNKVKKNFDTDINCQIINSIKSSYVKDNIIKNNNKIDKNFKEIYKKYLQTQNNENDENVIEYFSKKYNISPLNIVRKIFMKKYSKKFNKIDKQNLSPFDKNILKYSIQNDNYALIDNNNLLKDAIEFENKINKILTKLKIKFKTQEQLSQEQVKKYGKPINTPDFLILSDFYINGIKINWIDAKNFYGSCVQFIQNKIKLQTEKYIKNYGSGMIIFALNYNSDLRYDNILLSSYESFEKL